MDEERLRRARAEAHLAEAREELSRLKDERARLSAKNERLVAVLYVLRDREADELVRDLIEDALAFDGREADAASEEVPLEFALGEAGDRDE